MNKERGKYKKLISVEIITKNEKLLIESLSGIMMISDAPGLFYPHFPSSKFYEIEFQPNITNTPETVFDVACVNGKGVPLEAFKLISSNLEKLVMTQEQIIRFCQKYPKWVHKRTKDHNAYFLTESHGIFYIIDVFLNERKVLSTYLINTDIDKRYRYHHDYKTIIVFPRINY